MKIRYLIIALCAGTIALNAFVDDTMVPNRPGSGLHGYTVSNNYPYAGGSLTPAYNQRHSSLQEMKQKANAARKNEAHRSKARQNLYGNSALAKRR